MNRSRHDAARVRMWTDDDKRLTRVGFKSGMFMWQNPAPAFDDLISRDEVMLAYNNGSGELTVVLAHELGRSIPFLVESMGRPVKVLMDTPSGDEWRMLVRIRSIFIEETNVRVVMDWLRFIRPSESVPPPTA